MSIAGLALWALFALIVLVGLGFFARAVCNNPRHEPSTGMLAAILRLYTRIVHRVRYEGLGLIPPSGRPTLFVCNHTAGIDPLLVHLVSGHDIRWMMARDMRTPMLETFWNWMRIIDVDRIAGDPAAEEALFHLHNLVLAEGHSLLLTASAPPQHWGLSLPDLQSRMQGTQAATLSPPDDQLLGAVLLKLFSDRQINPTPDALNHLIKHMTRDFATARAVVAEMDRTALADRRRISMALARDVLARIDAG